VAFEVRRPGSTPHLGWLLLDDFIVEDERVEPVEGDGGAQRTWDEFVEGWDQAYEGCRRDHFIHCAEKADTVATGGKVQITMLNRGRAASVEFTRLGEAAPTPAAPVQMLEGVPGPTAALEVAEPVSDAAFSWRFEATTDELSPVTGTFRPLCGARTCSVTLTGNRASMFGRSLSFLGAAFPDGASAPHVVLARPSR
jgi:hypothetical protein